MFVYEGFLGPNEIHRIKKLDCDHVAKTKEYLQTKASNRVTLARTRMFQGISETPFA